MKISSWFLDRVQSERDYYSSLYEELVSSIDDELLSFLPFVSFVMLKPDAYLRGLVPEILRLLVGKEIYSTKYKLTSLTEEVIDNLYMFVKQKYVDSWWVMKKAYTLAPCLPSIVVGPKKGYDHLSARIRDVVGPTTPLAGENCQIRHKFAATHRVLNLIHGTDDPATSVREALVFFSTEDLVHCLEVASQLVEKKQIVEGFSSADYIDLAPQSTKDLRFSKVLSDTKVSVVSVMERQLGQVVEDRELNVLIGKLCQLLTTESNILSRNLTLLNERAELIRIRSYESIVISILKDLVEMHIKSIARGNEQAAKASTVLSKLHKLAQCIEVLDVLANEVKFRYADFARILATMAELNIRLNVYDEVILHTGWAVAPQEFRDMVSFSLDKVCSQG